MDIIAFVFAIYISKLFLEDPPYAQKQKDVYIDGKYSGKTVKVITDISVGTHELEISKQGHYRHQNQWKKV